MKMLLLPLAFLFGYGANPPAPIQLKGYFYCQRSLLEETGDAMSCYARTQRDCRNGNVILAFEKRRNPRNEKAVFEITDTVHVKTAVPARCLALTTCTTGPGKPRHYFVLFASDTNHKKCLPHMRRAWGVNAQNHLVAVPVATIKCLNGDYGAE